MRKVIYRGALGRCPNCGKSELFRSYLKQVDCCAVCGEVFKNIRADDAPPWLTILIAGHIVVPALLLIEQGAVWPLWFSMLLWPIAISLLVLMLLPRAKGVFIAVIWATRAPGFEP